MLKHGILGLLNYGEMTGYEIREVFKDSLNFFWTAQTSQIYRELKTIEKNGWAQSVLVEQVGKPDKKVFYITEQGKQELLRWLCEEDGSLVMRTPLLMKVFFFGERSVKENIEYFKRFAHGCREYIKGLSKVDGNIEGYSSGIDNPQKAVYWQMTADFGVRSLELYAQWAEDCAKRLEEIQ